MHNTGQKEKKGGTAKIAEYDKYIEKLQAVHVSRRKTHVTWGRGHYIDAPYPVGWEVLQVTKDDVAIHEQHSGILRGVVDAVVAHVQQLVPAIHNVHGTNCKVRRSPAFGPNRG